MPARASCWSLASRVAASGHWRCGCGRTLFSGRGRRGLRPSCTHTGCRPRDQTRSCRCLLVEQPRCDPAQGLPGDRHRAPCSATGRPRGRGSGPQRCGLASARAPSVTPGCTPAGSSHAHAPGAAAARRRGHRTRRKPCCQPDDRWHPPHLPGGSLHATLASNCRGCETALTRRSRRPRSHRGCARHPAGGGVRCRWRPVEQLGRTPPGLRPSHASHGGAQQHRASTHAHWRTHRTSCPAGADASEQRAHAWSLAGEQGHSLVVLQADDPSLAQAVQAVQRATALGCRLDLASELARWEAVRGMLHEQRLREAGAHGR